MKVRSVIVTATLLLCAPAMAQQQTDHSRIDHSQMNHSQMGGMMQPTAANPYGPAEMKMHQEMMSAVGADASETWVRKMIEHHRGGVEMSRIALAQAKDADARAKAQKTVAMQEKEIAELQGWLRSHGKQPQS